jgi:hypothetical protein
MWSVLVVSHLLAVEPGSPAGDPTRAPVVRAASSGQVFPLPAEMPACPPLGAWPEAPAWVLTDEQGPRYYVSTAWTYVVRLKPGKSLFSDHDVFRPESAVLTTYEDIRHSSFAPAHDLDPSTFWRRNYYGVFSAALLDAAKDRPAGVLAIMHCENKNEAFPWNKRAYPNTIRPVQNYAEDQYSGYFDGVYRDYWPCYFAFVAATWCPLAEKDGNGLMDHDLGPILWPSTGYIDAAGEHINGGLRHPSMIVRDGYIYVFYLEASRSAEPGRLGGIKVARARIEDGGIPGAFTNWFGGAFSEPSLPEGFAKERGGDFFAIAGGRSDLVNPEMHGGTVRFSVAKAEGTPYFLGVEEQIEEGFTQLYLRASRDLVHWGPRLAVPGCRRPWGENLHYPVFANKDYTSNTKIDPAGFYLVGSAASKMRAVRLSVTIHDGS